MADKFILIRHNGRTTSRGIRHMPRGRLTQPDWFAAAHRVAKEWEVTSFAFRLNGRWWLFETGRVDPIKSYGAEYKAAVVIWLAMRGGA